MPSAACTVKNGAGSPQTTPPYALVTPGNTVTIALADTSGASTWSIVCLYTDETSDAASVTASLTVNSGTKTATFTAPSAGKAYIFQSQINGGRDANGLVLAWTQTFKVATATVAGLVVGAANETYEHNATFGHTAIQNAAVRAYGSSAGGAVGSRYPLDAFDRHAWLLKETALPLVDGGTAAQDLTTLAGTVPVYADTGIVSPGIRFAATSLNYVRTDVAGTASNPTSATQLTLHGWVRSRAAAAVPQRLISKGYNTTGNTPPAAPESICLVIQNTNRLSCQTNVGGAGGTLKLSTGSNNAYIPINVWTHVGATYNAGTLKLYVNGTEMHSDATWPVSLDYNGASSGYWYIGGSSLASGSTSFDGAMNDWRVCDGVARSAAYMREVYLTSLGYANGVYAN